MIRGNNHFTTARMAICVALLCGTSPAFAQEAAVPVVQPAPPPVAAPVVTQPAPQPVTETVVAPPPVVATIAEEELVRPTAAIERPAQRTTVRAAPARSQVAPVAQAAAPEPALVDPTAAMVAPAEEVLSAPVTLGDAAAIAPVEESEPIAPVNSNDDNMIVVGGIAAALGLAGLGAVLARRRRRPTQQNVQTERNDTIASVERATLTNTPQHGPAAPIFAAPVALAEPTRSVVAERAAPRFVPTVADRDLPPVTDPLFAHRAELGPVTDPLFMHKTELPPVTDPLFADKEKYAGQTPAGSSFDSRRTWPATQTQHELEPAE